jgi:6-pyruvoyltetrahydropterin/6-carboxytetrahydropterin synthase
MLIWKEFTFEAAHQLPNVPQGHKCGRMHGHTFKVRLEFTGEVGEWTGWVMDFADIKDVVYPIICMIDHTVLNDYAGLENPTSENIALWFWLKVKPRISELSAVEVQETCSTGARYSE